MKRLLIFFAAICAVAINGAAAYAGPVDSVAAFVDEDVITLNELTEAYGNTKNINPGVTEAEVLNTMINRILIIREAKKLRIEAQTQEGLLNEYIDMKVRTFIKLREEDIRDFFDKNRPEFGAQEFEDVRDKIENYLFEREVNNRLKRHIEDLRQKAYVKIKHTGQQ